MDKTKTNRRTFLGFAGSVVGSLLIPDWGQRVFPMYPRTRIILPTEPMIEILRDGCVVDFVKGVKASGISPHELREILECRVGSVGGALELADNDFLAAEERRLFGVASKRARGFDNYRPAPGWSIQVGDVEWTGGNHIRMDRRPWHVRELERTDG